MQTCIYELLLFWQNGLTHYFLVNMLICIFFYSCFQMYGNLPYTYPPPFPLFPSFPSLSPVTSFLTARFTPHENVTAAILSYAVSHLHESTGKLPQTCADTFGHLTESAPV